MKIIISPDSFKNSLSSAQACDVIASAFKKEFPQAEYKLIPIGDGGEGSAAAAIDALGGVYRQTAVTGPLGGKVEAKYGLLPDQKTAIIDMAAGSGIELLERSELDPMRTTTYGLGELVLAAAGEGVETIIVGLGGSATVDGGAGFAEAVGIKLLDENGRVIPRGGGGLKKIASIDRRQMDSRLASITFRAASDVTNLLTGEKGAAKVFAPQKGADAAQVEELGKGLALLREKWIAHSMLSPADVPGDGAAGGLGAGLRACVNASIESGAELFAELTGFNRVIKEADILITGEGRTDGQSAGGKLCGVLAAKGAACGAKTILVSGSLSGDFTGTTELFNAALSTLPDLMSIDDLLKRSAADLSFTAGNAAKLLRIGFNFAGRQSS